ncbi:hypothetical protein [Aeromicrobium camelliae]|nr:hypothetical protein [Aeromicrobium camelliae]
MSLVESSPVDLACPEWCAVNHGTHELVADDDHQSDIHTVAALLRHLAPAPDGSLIQRTVASDIDVVRHHDATHDQEWIFIGNDEQQLDLSLESARHLHHVLGRLLRR